MSEQRDRFDEALDDALATYSKAPEREGLAGRILVRVTERAARKPLIRSFAVAICSLAAAACCLFWLQTSIASVENQAAKTSVPRLEKVQTSNLRVRVRDQVIVPSSATPVRVPEARRNRKRSIEPKRSQFPTPVPMSSEQRALLCLAMRSARKTPLGLNHLGEPIKPIEIAAIKINPL
jgi:hypothetical protein